MHDKTVILYLIGKPGTGKFTIATEISKQGYIICDNQLINNPIFSLLNYDGYAKIPEFAWTAISEIRSSVYNFLSDELTNNYVLTNVLCDVDYDYELYEQVQSMATRRNSLFVPVKLLINEKENIKRIQNHDRLKRFKTINTKNIYTEYELIKISHPNLLEFDISDISAKAAAKIILHHVNNLK